MTKHKILALLLSLLLLTSLITSFSVAFASDTIGEEKAPDPTTDLIPEEDTLYNRLMASSSLEEVKAIWEAATEEERDALSDEQKEEIKQYFAAFIGSENTPPTDPIPEEDTLFDRLMASASLEDAEAILEAATEDELDVLSEEQLEAIKQHVTALVGPGNIPPETVTFTEAGPFMPPVNVSEKSKQTAKSQNAGMSPMQSDDDGLVTSKAVEKVGDSYKFTLEAYSTGEVTTVTKTIPVDFVLVLDQSAFMDKNIGDITRQQALKTAVGSFISLVADKYAEPDSDHRIAIVTFNSTATILENGWKFVDTIGANILTTAVNGLPAPSGSADTAAGMSAAETLLTTEYNYSGENKVRQKVVVIFSAGVPSTNDQRFDSSVATNALAISKRLKEDHEVTVYTIGMFDGANPAQLYGDTGFYNISDGTIGSYWADFLFWIFGSVDKIDRPAGNRFLNFVSSNFKNATEIGLTSYTSTIGLRTGWKITNNMSRTATGYYLTAAHAEELTDAFTSISENVSSTTVELGADTVIKDIVMDYFIMPENTSDISVYTAAATAQSMSGGAWKDRELFAAKVSINGTAISVTGFDFTEKFVTKNPKEDHTYGSKLIIEFTLTLKDNFLGGNDLPTNEKASAVYAKDGNLAKFFEVPTINVPIPNVSVIAADKNVYLLGSLTGDQLKEGANVSVGGNTLDIREYDDYGNRITNFGLDAWKTSGVDITVTLKDADEKVIITPLKNLFADQIYKLEVSISSKNNPTGTTKSGFDKANINVFKPELTFKDSDVWYGDNAPANPADYDQINKLTELWKYDDIDSTSITMLGTKPTLALTYTPEAGSIKDSKIATKQDIKVKLDVKIGDSDIKTYTSFVHQACDPACGWTDPTVSGDPAFLLHVKTATLTITKVGGVAGEPYVFKILKDEDAYTEVTIVGNNSVTISELPVGKYSIVEDLKWSWRYPTPTCKYDNNTNATYSDITDSNRAGTVTCTNSLPKTNWLNAFSNIIKNIFATP